MDNQLSSQVWNVYAAPSKAFEPVKTVSRWVVPLLLCILGSFTFQALTSKYKMEDLKLRIQANEQLSPVEAQRRLANIERQKTHGISAKALLKGLAFVSAIQVAKIFGLALVLWLALQLTSKIRFMVILSVVSFASLIQLPEILIKAPLIMFKESTNVLLSSAVLLPPDWQDSALFNLLNGIDFFSCWTAVVLAIGIRVTAQVSPRIAYSTLGSLWAIWLFGRMMLGNIIQVV